MYGTVMYRTVMYRNVMYRNVMYRNILYILISYMEIARQDIEAHIMRQELFAIRASLRNNYKNIKRVSSENAFLEDVLTDYKTYYDYIKKQKEEQYDALRTLTSYIENMSQELNTTEYLLRETQRDQNDIIKEMTNVKRELQDLMVD